MVFRALSKTGTVLPRDRRNRHIRLLALRGLSGKGLVISKLRRLPELERRCVRDRYHRGGLAHARAMVRHPEPRDSRSMDTVLWADRMFVNIASYFFGFIVFFALSCFLLLGGVRLMSGPDRYPEK